MAATVEVERGFRFLGRSGGRLGEIGSVAFVVGVVDGCEGLLGGAGLEIGEGSS